MIRRRIKPINYDLRNRYCSDCKKQLSNYTTAKRCQDCRRLFIQSRQKEHRQSSQTKANLTLNQRLQSLPEPAQATVWRIVKTKTGHLTPTEEMGLLREAVEVVEAEVRSTCQCMDCAGTPLEERLSLL